MMMQGQQQFPPPQPGAPSSGIIPMDHYPSWKLHKNPFWRVKSPGGVKSSAVAPNVMTGEMEIKPQLFSYEAHQDIGGVVTLQMAPGKKVEHLGIKVQFIGRIDMVRKDSEKIEFCRIQIPHYSRIRVLVSMKGVHTMTLLVCPKNLHHRASFTKT